MPKSKAVASSQVNPALKVTHESVKPSVPKSAPALHQAPDVWSIDKYIASGADLLAKDRLGRNALHVHAARLDMYAVDRLLKEGLYVDAKDKQGRTALHLALNTPRRFGHARHTVECLLQSEAKIDMVDKKGRTPAHYAAHRGRLGCLRTLVSMGANLMLADETGATPMDLLKRSRRAGRFRTLARLAAPMKVRPRSSW